MELDLALAFANLEHPATATFPNAPEASEFADKDLVKAVHFGMSTGIPVRIIGDPGTGKTSFVKYLPAALGVKVVYFPAATLAPEDMAVPMPTREGDRTVLDFQLYEELMDPAPKVLLFDELSRSSKAVLNQCLEIVQEKSLAGHAIPNVVGIFACDNEGVENGITLQPDFAQADRWVTLKVGPNDSPWQRKLAERFPQTDLSKVYKVYSRLTPRLRYLLSPRTLEHVLYNLLAGNPGIWGLPLHAGQRARLVDESEMDKTEEILSAIASALNVVNRDTVADPMRRAVDAAIRDGVNILVEGDPGIGKTAFVKSKVAETGIRAIYLSAPVVSPDNLALPFPKDGKLEVMIMKALAEPGPKILILDEIWRCSAATRSKLMEILQERSIGGVPIDDLVCVIAMNNPKKLGNYTLDVGKPDRAQADRFFMSITVQADDIPSFEWMLKTMGDEAEPFIEWWKLDLDDQGRKLMSRRALMRLLALHRQGHPLEWGKVYIGGSYVPVPLGDLERRLADRPPARLRHIAENVEEYERRLMEGGPQAPADTEAHRQVFDAFWHAELSQLEADFECVTTLLRRLQPQHRIALIRPGGDKQVFWRKALSISVNGPKA